MPLLTKTLAPAPTVRLTADPSVILPAIVTGAAAVASVKLKVPLAPDEFDKVVVPN